MIVAVSRANELMMRGTKGRTQAAADVKKMKEIEKETTDVRRRAHTVEQLSPSFCFNHHRRE